MHNNGSRMQKATPPLPPPRNGNVHMFLKEGERKSQKRSRQRGREKGVNEEHAWNP